MFIPYFFALTSHQGLSQRTLTYMSCKVLSLYHIRCFEPDECQGPLQETLRRLRSYYHPPPAILTIQ